MLTIKVLGSGCANCRRVETVVRQTVERLGVEAEILQLKDYDEILKYPMAATPGLVVNEQLVCAGRVPSEAEVTGWISAALGKT